MKARSFPCASTIATIITASAAERGKRTSHSANDPTKTGAAASTACVAQNPGSSRNRKPGTAETYFLLSAGGFSLTLLIRQYLHYWALALPFIILLCVRSYRKKEASRG